MYVVLQRFKIRLGTLEAVGRHVDDQLLPLVKQIPGFVAFYLADAGNRTVASVGLFESQEAADRATHLCRDWFRSDWPAFLAVPPELTRGAALAGGTIDRIALPMAARTTWPQAERRTGVDRRWGRDRRAGSESVLVSAGTGA